ncbi:MAG: hypothetical protein QNK79_07915 [Synechococcus sp. ArSW.bin.68]
MAMTCLLGRSSSLRTRGVSSLLATTSIVLWVCQAPSASAQRMVKKIESRCPLGYVDTLNGKCSTLGMKTHTVQAIDGRSCPSGWLDVGGGYCRKQ